MQGTDPKPCRYVFLFKHVSVNLIILCGDVEVNPSPYRIMSCISASFSQGHEKFRRTNGRQCTCMSLYSIVFSAFKRIPSWSKHDLDCVIEKGDKLYKNQNTLEYLNCPPRSRSM